MKAKKVLNSMKNIFLILFGIIIISFVLIFIIHKYQSSKEYNMLEEAGYINPVLVGDYDLNTCIYGKDDGKHTIVGISGMGSNDFSVLIKPFMNRFADENKIVVVERAGYGMSDDTKAPQTVEQIVSDYRFALKNSGCDAPYILMAHSLGGDYATYWQSTYPDEIEAVIYFDPNNIIGDISIIDDHPDEQVWWEDDVNGADPIFNKMGIARIYMELTDVKPWISPVSKDNSEYMKALWEHSVSTFAQNSEAELSAENMKKTEAALVANDIPKLYIDATYYTKEDMMDYFGFLHNSGMANFDEDINPENKEEMDRLWEIIGKSNVETHERFIESYIEKLGSCQYVNISGDHYIFAYKINEVEQAVRSFIDELEQTNWNTVHKNG